VGDFGGAGDAAEMGMTIARVARNYSMEFLTGVSMGRLKGKAFISNTKLTGRLGRHRYKSSIRMDSFGSKISRHS